MINIESIKKLINGMVRESPLNKLISVDGGPIFDEPLIGVADGHDALFTEYKKIIDENYLTPAEVLQQTAQTEQKTVNDDISVICWALPLEARIKSSNAVNKTIPASHLWHEAQRNGEKFNDDVREQLVKFFGESGCLAVAPVRSPLFARTGRYQTNWSERHALYAAGLGTFGLSRWLITGRGVAHRCGSVVANVKLEPTPRRYLSHTESCLFLSGGNCGKCIQRCPSGAITTDGLDKAKCREYLDAHSKELGCGLCQTGVPCESRIPAVKK
jgi:epoxyqueuosine reductase